MHTPGCGLDDTSASLGCLCIANPSLLPRSLFWSPFSSSQTPCAPADRCLRLGTAGSGQDPLYWSLSVLPATSQLLHFPLSLWSSLLCASWYPYLWSGFPEWANLSSFTTPPRDAGPILIGIFFFFHPSWLYDDLSYNFGFMRYSASIQQVFCENCSTCRCIFDVFVGGSELHILLLCHLNPASFVSFNEWNFLILIKSNWSLLLWLVLLVL